MNRLHLAHLYPDLMSTYGDRGNILTLMRRCQWRGIELTVTEVGLGESLQPGIADLYFFGGGQDLEQRAVSEDLRRGLAEVLRQDVESGVVVLAICGGYQLLGHYFRTKDGEEIPGLGILDLWTLAGETRHVGNVVAHSDLLGRPEILVGFENHSGLTYLGQGCAPLASVEVGTGNNGQDGTEGAAVKGVIGSYLHGSLLPRNPWLSDHLIESALRRRYGEARDLTPLGDERELAARDAMLRISRKTNGPWHWLRRKG